MTLEETARAIELLVQSQQVMGKNLESLFEIAQLNTRDIGTLTERINRLTERMDRLALIVADYIRGLRNGHSD